MSLRVSLSPLLFVSIALLPAAVQAESADIATLRQHYMAYRIGESVDADQIAEYIKTLGPDGSWPDIDYKDNHRSGWKPRTHVRRILRMAKAYRLPGQTYARDPALKTAILTGLKHWLDKDYQCPNWWYNKIAVPDLLANTLVFMGDDMPAPLAKQTLTIVSRAKIGMTGQNKTWLASIVFVRALFEGDLEQIKHARETILSELRVTTREGIQPDWSFHQHGPQQQFGNYGSAFGSTITSWGEIFQGTSFALNKEELDIIGNYLLEGPSWILWKGRMDLSGCGRQINHDCQTRKGRGTLKQLERMVRIDPDNAPLYESRLRDNRDGEGNSLVGNKHFWRSDMMVHRRPDWYASVKMSSRRVIGSETCNSENMRGMHLGDGVLLIYRTGTEYENIQPFWDWHRLPGTTCDQSIKNLTPGKSKCMLPTDFVGGVTDGLHGVAVLDYKRQSLTARKSWFFTDNAIICLGAGITASEGGQVLTSVQQALLQGDVTLPSGKVSPGTYQLKAGDWVHHAGIGYQILDGQNPTLNISSQTGDWKDLYPKKPDNPQQGDVFNLWFDHGKMPKNQSYAYIMVPDARVADISSLSDSAITTLSNTSDLQAVSVSSGEHVMAVFYTPGQFEYDVNVRTTESIQPLKPSNHPRTPQVVEVDTPCLVMIDGNRIFVSDPTQKKKQIQLTVNGRVIPVNLPVGGNAGRTVEVTAVVEEK